MPQSAHVTLVTMGVSPTTPHGSQRIGLDILGALSREGYRLGVLCWQGTAVPERVDDTPLARPHFEAIGYRKTVAALAARRVGLPAVAARVRQDLEHPGTWADRLRRPPRADVVVINGTGSGALLELRRGGIGNGAKVLVVHESPRHFTDLRRRDAVATMMASMDRVVCASALGLQEWIRLASLDPARCHTIPNCANESRARRTRARSASDLRAETGFEDGTFHVVCVASVQARKGQDLLVSAAERLAPSGRRLAIHLLGPADSTWALALARRVQEGPAATSVRFHGSIDDPYPYIAAADALCLPSRAESFPLATLEALALGTAVVASRADGIVEQIEDGVSGLLVDVDDATGLSEALARLCDEPALTRRLSEAARERYLSQFARAHLERGYAEVVAAALADRRRQPSRR